MIRAAVIATACVLATGAPAQDRTAQVGALTIFIASVYARECGQQLDWPRVRVYARRLGVDTRDIFAAVPDADMREVSEGIYKDLRANKRAACAKAMKQYGPTNVGEPMWEPLFAVQE